MSIPLQHDLPKRTFLSLRAGSVSARSPTRLVRANRRLRQRGTQRLYTCLADARLANTDLTQARMSRQLRCDRIAYLRTIKSRRLETQQAFHDIEAVVVNWRSVQSQAAELLQSGDVIHASGGDRSIVKREFFQFAQAGDVPLPGISNGRTFEIQLLQLRKRLEVC